MQSLRITALGGVMAALLSCNPEPLLEEVDLAKGPDMSGPCVNLQCKVVDCQAQNQAPTTITGVVNIPAGNLPLYGATVYIPNEALPPLVAGPTCDQCNARLPGSPVVQARTDVFGRFVLKDAPAGTDIPLVISLGKWRRQVKISTVPACATTNLDVEQTRLPKNRSEGDIPRIALTTGGFDAIECLLRKIGLSPQEFTKESDGGRVNLFAGHGGTDAYTAGMNGGARFTPAFDTGGMANGWWSQPGSLNPYDILILSCEGGQNVAEKSVAARAALQDYVNRGGRVFASHWHNVWISAGPAPLSSVASFFALNEAQEFSSITASIDTGGEKGQALADWLVNVGASNPRGSLPILMARNTVKSITANLTQRLVYYKDQARGGIEEPQYFSFNAPVGAAPGQQCGRMVFTDIHVSGNDAGTPNPNLDLSAPRLPFPTGCVTQGLSPQEKALIFLLFDLTGCVTPVIP